MAASQFDKDFGYLMPFLDKIASAANALADPGARAEAARLVADEKQRWQRLRQLLSGASSEAAGSKASSPAAGATVTSGEKQTDVPTRERPSFTVGSLRLPRN